MGKFYNLVDKFFVGLQSNFSPEDSAKKFLQEKVEPLAINQEKGQIFHPADVIESGAGMVEVHFIVVTNGKEKWKKLVFFSKVRALAARFGEDKAFGFEGTHPGPQYKDCGYLLLAFPSISGPFATVYFQIQPRRGHMFFLAVDAEESADKEKVIVRARIVSRKNCPRHLRFK